MPKNKKKNKDQFVTPKCEAVVAGLDIHPDTLEDDIVSQPNLYEQAARYHQKQLSERFECKARLEALKVETAQKFRQAALDTNKKVTVQQVADHVTGHEDVIAAERKHQLAQLATDYSGRLLEGYNLRASSLRLLVNLRSSEAASGVDSLRRTS